MPTPDTKAPVKAQTSTQDKAAAFRALHARDGAFVIPNPWDIGSARILQAMGYEALATTSVGFANAIGKLDYQVSRDEKIAHCKALADATDVPINADLENGFDADPTQAAETIKLAAQVGIVGGSIEDSSGDPSAPIYSFDHAVERVAAAAEMARALPGDFMLTARAENLLHGVKDLDDTIKRLQAFEAAGADVLYAPGLQTLEQIKMVCDAVSAPVNVLGVMVRGASVGDMAEAGAKRISVGGAFARAALAGFITAAEEMLSEGTTGFMKDLKAARKADALLRGDGAGDRS